MDLHIPGCPPNADGPTLIKPRSLVSLTAAGSRKLTQVNARARVANSLGARGFKTGDQSANADVPRLIMIRAMPEFG
jgi:hypothetical protein